MFENKKRPVEHSPAIHTLLGKGSLWKGEIHMGANSLRIEGSVEGTVHSEGEVTIAPTGLMNGTVHAKHLIVTGKAEGVFKVVECLEIHGTGWVEGEVELGSLVVDEGGTLQGTCIRRGASKEAVAIAAANAAKPKTEERFPERPALPAGPHPSAPLLDQVFAKGFETKGKA